MSRSCRSKKECIVRCGADVDVELNHKPCARLHKICHNKNEFEVELELEVNPCCKLHHKKTVRDGCKWKSILGVEVDFKADAKARCHPCGKTAAKYRLDVEIPAEPHVEIKKRCGGSRSRSSSSSSSSRKCSRKSSHKSSRKCSRRCSRKSGQRHHGRRFWY